MKIALVSPSPTSSRTGNGVTAARWSALFADLGHQVAIHRRWQRGNGDDVMVALHARRSHPSIAGFRRVHRRRPLIVVLGGTDLYRDLPRGDAATCRSLDLADRVVVLQERGPASLPAPVRAKARVIEQSAEPGTRRRPNEGSFDVCVLSHLRPVKDSLRPAKAARRLADGSELRVLHAGAPLDGRTAHAARREQAINPRYRWLGPLAGVAARELLLGSRLLAVPSKLEGGANAVCEALACGLPMIASAVDGNIGLLGEGYAGLYPQADTAALAGLLGRAESDAAFYRRLERQTEARRHLVEPTRERQRWGRLLDELA